MTTVAKIKSSLDRRDLPAVGEILRNCLSDPYAFEQGELDGLWDCYRELVRQSELPTPQTCLLETKGLAGLLLFRGAVEHANQEGDQPNALLADPDVRRTIGELFDLSFSAWTDLTALTFHRPGTTSWILQMKSGRGGWFALKLLKPQYHGIRSLSVATAGYRQWIDALPSTVKKSTPQISESGPKFILMEFVSGLTLEEFIQENAALLKGHAGGPDSKYWEGYLRELGNCFGELCDILGACANAGAIHQDLSPSNILLPVVAGSPRGSTHAVCIIDFGVNFLLQEGVGSGKRFSRAQVYIAPEVLEGSRDVDYRADFYSIGRLLLDAVTLGHSEEGVDDEVFQVRKSYAGLGNLLDGLLARERRLRAPEVQSRLGTKGAQESYVRLRERLMREVSMFSRIAPRPSGGAYSGAMRSAVEICIDAFAMRLWFQERPTVPGDSERPSRGLGWLARLNLLSLLLVLVQGTRSISPGFNALFAWPGVATLGLPSSPFDATTRWCAAGVGMTFGITAFLYYTNVFATLNWRGAPRTTRIIVSANCFVYSVPILLAIWRPSWWPGCSTAGVLFVALTNFLLYRLSSSSLDRFSHAARQESPHVLREYLHSFRLWWVGMFLYGLGLMGVAIGLATNLLHDQVGYAIGVVVMNCWLIFGNCLTEAGRMRAGLETAFYRARAIRSANLD